jgi:RNA polymerase-binding transcription factor DksA
VEEPYGALLAKVRHDLDEAEAALKRLDDDSYGRCERCGWQLDAELEASPITRHCAGCR